MFRHLNRNMTSIIFAFNVVFLSYSAVSESYTSIPDDEFDLLQPYPYWLPRQSLRHVRSCLPPKYNNITSEIHASSVIPADGKDNRPPAIDMKYFFREVGSEFERRLVIGHRLIINDPLHTVSVLEPGGMSGGCGLKLRRPVQEAGLAAKCLYAVNAGFFNVTDGACMGNVISNGRLGHSSHGIQNVHFGIFKNGSIFIGYLLEDDAELLDSFQQLVGGVIWLVRNGENFIDVSKDVECPDRQAEPTLQHFIDTMSARTAIGYDNQGKVVIIQVDGKTHHRGMSLYEFANLLISMGMVNAVNLDGGGSATLAYKHVVINYPSDIKDGYGTPRNVSTVLCITDYPCGVPYCSGHGICEGGVCKCDEGWGGVLWVGPDCSQPSCSALGDCFGNGVCTEHGCVCKPGWTGRNCSEPCMDGTFGSQCSGQCACANSYKAGCNKVNGQCACLPGYRGLFCDTVCEVGTYGEGCEGRCQCNNGCFCHHVTGSCHLNTSLPQFYTAGQCWGDLQVVGRQFTTVSPEDFRLWLTTLILISSLTILSLLLNALLISRTFCTRSADSSICCPPSSRHDYEAAPTQGSDADDSIDSDTELPGTVKNIRQKIPRKKVRAGAVLGPLSLSARRQKLSQVKTRETKGQQQQQQQKQHRPKELDRSIELNVV